MQPDDDQDKATGKKRKRNVMREFSIGEISFVDRPAQEGALMTITKAMRPPTSSPTTELDAAIAKVRERDGCTASQAMSKVRAENPALYDRLQATPVPAPAAITKADADRRTAQQRFDDAVEELRAERRIPRVTAARLVRERDPDLAKAAFN